MGEYDKAYMSNANWFGKEPDDLLVRFMDRILATPGSILDLGAGQGRHTFPLSASGKQVVAVDPSAAAVAQLARERLERKLDFSIVRSGFRAISPEQTFSAILVFGLIQELSPDSIRELARQCRAWCAPDGLVCITAFMVADPGFSRLQASMPMADRNAFQLPDGRWQTYLEPGELVRLFPGFRSEYCREHWGPVHRHSNGAPERHARIEAVLAPA